ncbi:MAG: hypothetical protein OEZ01_14695 [Candidatus Heimdallarchaeota archaeon]|nr:hypothetical protein [Candidatus Heimdallarchaeota archaeon]MDH5647257.1 hypothetical protein [Candidatus Heimdallarchaeota archaeon]
MAEKWRLEIIQGDCGICDLCALACSNEKFGVMSPYLSAIRVNHRSMHTKGRAEGGPGILPCWHCENPPCYPACPYESMSINEHNVVNIFLDKAPEGYENCISCMKCVKACATMHGESSIFISPHKNRPMKTKTGREIMKYSLFKCDMCNGDPACVKICPREAIKFIRYS